MLEITLLRHGRSRADDEAVHEGWYDSPLTKLGEFQAESLAKRWKLESRQFNKVIVSPLIRASKTAEIIYDTLEIPFETNQLWIEMNNGDAKQISRAEALFRFPRPANRNPYHPIFPNGESAFELHRRANLAIEQLIQKTLEGQVLIVAHGGILNAALRNILGVYPLHNEGGVWFEFWDTGYAQVQYNPNSNIWLLQTINNTHHLQKS